MVTTGRVPRASMADRQRSGEVGHPAAGSARKPISRSVSWRNIWQNKVAFRDRVMKTRQEEKYKQTFSLFCNVLPC